MVVFELVESLRGDGGLVDPWRIYEPFVYLQGIMAVRLNRYTRMSSYLSKKTLDFNFRLGFALPVVTDF